MFIIDPTTQSISASRGDSYSFEITVYSGDRMTPINYAFQDGDVLYMAVQEPNQVFEDAILKKKFTKDDLIDDSTIKVSFTPEDTMYLLPGLYYYQFKLVRAEKDDEGNNLVDTIIPLTEFYIEEG